jgi:hypothetical protein
LGLKEIVWQALKLLRDKGLLNKPLTSWGFFSLHSFSFVVSSYSWSFAT